MTASDIDQLYGVHPMPARNGKPLFRVGSWVWHYEEGPQAKAEARATDEFAGEHLFYAAGPTPEAAQEAAVAYVHESYRLRLRPYEVEAELRENSDGIIEIAGPGIAEENETLQLISPPPALQPSMQVYCLTAKTSTYSGGYDNEDPYRHSTTLLAIATARYDILQLRDLVRQHAHDIYPAFARVDGRVLPFLDSDVSLEKLQITRVDVI